LSEVFQSLVQRVPEMVPLLESLKRYCMREDTFDEYDFRTLLEVQASPQKQKRWHTNIFQDVVESTPNLRRLKLNLPFQVVGQLCTTATLLLATTFSALAKRPIEHKQLETLVLDHVSDTTVNAICNNHMDLSNAIKAFMGLKNLVLSIKRQEPGLARQDLFAKHLWFLIRKAEGLESLCLIGWNVKRSIMTRRNQHTFSLGDWNMRSLPYMIDDTPILQQLRFLELRRVDIDPRALISLITDSAKSLKEIYLSEVFIKVFGASDGNNISLWIGHPDITQPDEACWLAPELKKIEGLELGVLRATCLGYDDFEPDRNSLHPDYDLKDPTGKERSFDERFVDAVCGVEPVTIPAQTTFDISSLPPIITEPDPRSPRDHNEWDAETYLRETNNPTSYYKRCIDGYFFNHNEQALKELQNIISVADRGMTIISEEISRSREVAVDGGSGGLV
jgi:hypothetical protein